MKKALCMAAAAILATIAVGCGGGQGESEPENPADAEDAPAQAEEPSQPQPQAAAPAVGATAEGVAAGDFPIAFGENMAGDDEHIYFYYDTMNIGGNGGTNGIYRANRDLTEATLVYEQYRANPVCLFGETLLSEGNGGVAAVDGQSNEISQIIDGIRGARSISTYAKAGQGAPAEALVIATDDEQLLLARPTEDGGAWETEVLGGRADLEDNVRYAITGDGVVYFTQQDGGYELRAYDMETGEVATIAEIRDEWAFAVVGDDVYYLVESPDGTRDDEGRFTIDLMRSDAAGNAEPTGVSGSIGNPIAYGDLLFYDKGGEGITPGTVDENGEVYYLGRPCCYNTATGVETIIDREAYSGMDVYPMGACNGYLYLNAISTDEYTGDQVHHVFFERIDGTGEPIDAEALTRAAGETEQASAWREAVDAANSEAARQAYEESVANEPYGPGTSKLRLSADERSACYRLVRRDGTVEFQVLLAPGESVTEEFPCGRYTLRVAEGDEWISDEEAFGPDGHYSATDLFTFEEGGSYTIGAGSRGDFHESSQW